MTDVHPWVLTKLLGGAMLLAGIMSLVWTSDLSWTTYGKLGHENADTPGLKDRSMSSNDCRDRKALGLAEVAGLERRGGEHGVFNK